MKKLIFSIIAVCGIAMTMTSCLGDDSIKVHQLTANEKTTIMNNMVGSYSGYVKYFNDSLKVDSIQTTWTVNADSTVTVNYPVALLSEYIDTTSNAAKQALASAPAEKINLSFYVPYSVYETSWTNGWKLGYYECSMGFLNTTHEFSVGEHKFVITFSNNVLNFYNTSLQPLLTFNNNKTSGNILLGSLKVDGVNHSLSYPTWFIGSK